ncbi:hypothetical protein BDB01DRAFT_778503 [Pilobolus umbonatus]|nr:hypothetical protein BDB01DRAFT_778503 [Pilobolus umbonatus]
MQRLIKERNISYSLLERAETLSRTWDRLQSKSISKLQAINNMIAQQSAVLESPSTVEHVKVVQPRLLYKQSVSLDTSVCDLHELMTLFKDVIKDWTQLKKDTAKHVTHISMDNNMNTHPISTESLIQTSAMHPTEVNDIISTLAYMYTQEYHYKSNLIDSLPTYLNSTDQMDRLLDCWNNESRIDQSTVDYVSERIKLYKVVKKVLESTD